jgi:outer membrane protein TolC
MLIFFSLITILSVKVTIANDVTPLLDLKQVIKIAKDNNPAIQLAREKINQIEAQKKLATSSLYPTIGWTLSSSYQKDAVYTGTSKFNGDPYNQYSSDVKLQQTLFAYGSLSAIKQVDYDKKIQDLNIEVQERTLTQNVIESFYRFILNQHLLQNLLSTQDIIQKSLATANERYSRGRGQLLDVLQVKTQLALITPQIEQAKNQLENAANQLTYYMGDKDRGNIKLKGKLKTLILNNIQKNIDIKSFHLPEHDINQMQIETLDYAKDVTYGKNFPTVKLVGDYLYNNYKKAELFSDYSHAWAVQLQLTIPLFSGFSSLSERHILNSQEAQLYRAKQDLENSLSLNQVSSMRNLQTVETSLVSALQAANLAEQSQNEAHRNYRLATIDFLQFLSVEQAALQAKTSLDQLKFQSIITYSNYFVASGQPLSVLVDLLVDEGKK